MVLIWMQVALTGGKKCIYDEVMGNVALFVNVDDGKIRIDIPLIFIFIDTASWYVSEYLK